MHIVLISACKGKAIKKTIAILDSYAQRSGDRTWLTPITEQGLEALKKVLRRKASKNTAVACFRNDKRQRMKLLWRVGNQKFFNHKGISSVHFQGGKSQQPYPQALKIAAQLSYLTGLTHDLGKFNQAFQEKLKQRKAIADPVRHEWLSLTIVKALINNKTWEEAWQQDFQEMKPFDHDLQNPNTVLCYLIATHHRLIGENGNVLNDSLHIRDKNHKPTYVSKPDTKLWQEILQQLHKLQQLNAAVVKPSLYWRAVATISRIALIFADHQVSSQQVFSQNATAYANTIRPSGEFNQSVDWHLQHVGQAANARVFDLFQLKPPTLPQDIIERLDQPTPDPRFAWQNRAVYALKSSLEKQDIPHLVLNIAGTGSGKTRMNVKALVALRPVGLRLATALNLRTLTLQTADAYAEQLNIPKEEMACVLGDKLSQDLFNQDKILKRTEKKEDKTREVVDSIDEDENTPQDDYDVAENQDFFEYNQVPDWLAHFLNQPKVAKMRAVIGAPVLISTIDFLINAGEPHRQQNHALAMLRLMTSDLILDELDSYDPKALLAVLRLVMFAAFFGRHVVASSATLSKPVASMLWRSYAKGIAMRALFFEESEKFAVAIIDNQIKPSCLLQTPTQVNDFNQFYQEHVEKMLKEVAEAGCFRKPFLQPIEPKNKIAFGEALIQAINTLHQAHAWQDEKTSKKLSFGLVRIANIQTALKVAKVLAKELPGAFVACYHSQHFVIQRHFIEKTLDELLTRKGKHPNAHIPFHPEIATRLQQSSYDSIPFIVVATPVEEIGRDHDFDWAVIEPSSAQSIVQTAGRVNRHRLQEVTKPNIAILQFNRREIEGKDKCVFKWPGLEIKEEVRYCSHDLKELLDWNDLTQIDARMRFDHKHKFAKYDDESIEKITSSLLKKQLSEGNNPHLWMSVKTYQDSPLRSHEEWQHKLELTAISLDNDHYQVRDEEGKIEIAVQRNLKVLEEAPKNVWLYQDDQQLLDLLEQYKIYENQGLKVTVNAKAVNEVIRHQAFGFYRDDS